MSILNNTQLDRDRVNCFKCYWVVHPHYDDFDNLSVMCSCPYMEMIKDEYDYYNQNHNCRYFYKQKTICQKIIKFLRGF